LESSGIERVPKKYSEVRLFVVTARIVGTMKLHDYARKMGVRYETAWRWWKAGIIPGRQMPTGTIIVDEPDQPPEYTAERTVTIYARVSAAENRPHLQSQAERLATYCATHGYQIARVVKEIGSGVSDSRPKLLALLADPSIRVIVVEHKDRATRFGFRYLEAVLAAQGRRMEVVNLAGNNRADLIGDLVAIVYSFSARLYGPRRAKRKTAAIRALLESEDHRATGGATPD
jgi:predicted site-specific integrase-resolvase